MSKNNLDLHLHRKICNLSLLGQDPSSIQVLWRSVELFFYNPADKPSNKLGSEWTKTEPH